MERLAVFLADGFEEIEGLTVVDVCRRAGLDVAMVAIGDSRTVNGSHGIRVEADRLLSETDFGSIDMLILPGGKLGTVNLEQCAPLMEQIDAFYRTGKYVAAICAAPGILAHRGILAGKRACCHPSVEPQLTAAGAELVRDPAVIAGNVITGRGMGCSVPFGLAIVSVCRGREKADAIAEQIVYERVTV